MGRKLLEARLPATHSTAQLCDFNVELEQKAEHAW